MDVRKAKKILTRYAKYYNDLQRLGEYHLSEMPTIKKIGVSRGNIQSAYKEMKVISFKGDLVDFLCFVSMEYAVFQYGLHKRQFKEVSMFTFAEFIFESFLIESFNINNLMRLSIKNPNYLYERVGSNKRDKDTIDSKIEGFKKIYEQWLQRFLLK